MSQVAGRCGTAWPTARGSHPQTFARRADAARLLSELERQPQAGADLVNPAGAKVTVGAHAEGWLVQHPGLRPRTVEVYRSLLRRHVLPILGEVPLGRLDTPAVKAWRGLRGTEDAGKR